MSVFYNDSELQMETNLILCIEEHYNKDDYSLVDTRLFIGWSEEDTDYFVRGKREDSEHHKYAPYAFHCKSINDLYNFIEFVVGKKKNVSVTLYNYNKIDKIAVSDMTYELFKEQMDINYEIAAYDEVKLKRSLLVKWLRMIQNAYNWILDI
jgi:hypothetical protein